MPPTHTSARHPNRKPAVPAAKPIRQPLFEGHIALATGADTKQILGLIADAGITLFYVDFFRAVINLDRRAKRMGAPSSSTGHTFTCSTPTGHDLHSPGLMLTVRSASYRQLAAQINAMLSILSSLGVEHNFEVEKLMSRRGVSMQEVDVSREFPGYARVGDAPLFENHIGWRRTGNWLPFNSDIVRTLVALTGFAPHQIVDFSERRSYGPVTDRVVSFYQATLDGAMEFAPVLASAAKKLHATYTISEQVCVVGAPAH